MICYRWEFITLLFVDYFISITIHYSHVYVWRIVLWKDFIDFLSRKEKFSYEKGDIKRAFFIFYVCSILKYFFLTLLIYFIDFFLCVLRRKIFFPPPTKVLIEFFVRIRMTWILQTLSLTEWQPNDKWNSFSFSSVDNFTIFIHEKHKKCKKQSEKEEETSSSVRSCMYLWSIHARLFIFLYAKRCFIPFISMSWIYRNFSNDHAHRHQIGKKKNFQNN